MKFSLNNLSWFKIKNLINDIEYLAVNGSMTRKALGELYPFKQVVLENPDKIFIIRRH